MEKKPKESQYQVCFDLKNTFGFSRFGLMSNQVWHDDPKRLVFLLSRYKFVAKMLSGKQNVLEIGCADGFGSRLIAQEVGKLTLIDFDPVFISDAQENMDPRWKYACMVLDPTEDTPPGNYDAAYSLDVLEHIPKEKEHLFLQHIISAISSNGILIIGTPSLESQKYASPPSREGHVNCKDHKELRKLLSGYFHNVFLFSMNDEVVHTGFYPMAHYLLAICCGKKV
ncbi:class I SAM-dependent methyltransferase [Methanoregula sp. UBA64]|jgi:2-polyprenyl-3-methyl-5-hydroxy-6-metoxy-1,4-benzoquinol methylase|uniref:class I SAM-dependent methyltransferase n=1 Tax=Methanoregula sp. UBA64 TaxID=1915554 RepID=UPI0025D1463B|nr:class I SAM-dependent methyltransferase [Methanoregula sp. UBA64]